MKVLQIFAVVMLMSIASAAYAKTTNRFVYLEVSPDIPEWLGDVLHDDARGRLVIGITDQLNTQSRYGREVVVDLDFSKLNCLGPFDLLASSAIYVLYINEQRIVMFNTQCKYAISGGLGGDFSTALIFTDNDMWEVFLIDPVNDPIHAVVRLEHPDYEPYDPPFWLGPKILEGWLTD
jgi:hypothetical protein